MDDQLLLYLYHRLFDPGNVRRPARCVYGDAIVVLIHFLALLFRCLALHEGRVVYATERPDREHPNIDKVASNWGVNIESGEFFSVVTAAKRREFMGFGRDSHRQSLTDAPVGGNVVLFFVWHRWWMPLWFFCLLTAAYPLWRAAKAARVYWRSKLESRIGLCPSCGYDLRATPDRCPECGMTPAKASA